MLRCLGVITFWVFVTAVLVLFNLCGLLFYSSCFRLVFTVRFLLLLLGWCLLRGLLGEFWCWVFG